jgi:hypothetical protein
MVENKHIFISVIPVFLASVEYLDKLIDIKIQHSFEQKDSQERVFFGLKEKHNE